MIRQSNTSRASAGPIIAAIAVACVLLAGCASTPAPRTDVPAVSSFTCTYPWNRVVPGQTDWLLLDARLLWFNPDKLGGLNWRLSVPDKGAGVYHTVVSDGRLAELLAEADGLMVPSKGASCLGLFRAGSLRPIMLPAPRTLPPGPDILTSTSFRGAIDPKVGIVLDATIEATEFGEREVKRSGVCRVALGRSNILLVDLTRLLGRGSKPKLVLAVAADQFEWKDGILARSFPWRVIRQTEISGRRIRNVWMRTQTARH